MTQYPQWYLRKLPRVKNARRANSPKGTAASERRRRRYLEHDIQTKFVAVIRNRVELFPEFEMMYANQGGGERPAIVERDERGKVVRRFSPEGKRLKAEGGRAGIPDLFFASPQNDFHGLYLETKTPDGSLSKDQKWWFAHLRARGYRCEVYRSVEQGIEIVCDYFGIQNFPI